MTSIKLVRIPLNIDTDSIAKRLKSLKNKGTLWESRSADFPFYTVGKASYLDGRSGKYYPEVRILNPILLHLFNDLYVEVAGKLSKHFGEWVTMKDNLALPGFHIFPSDEKLVGIAGHWHLDYPHTTLGMGDEDAHAFTVAIELPKCGGGLDTKDEYIGYNVGELVLHDGLTNHRISSYKEYHPDEYRITLQGHIIRDGASLIMFW